MSKDLEAIIQYIEQPNTDYAYMLTGAWGSGKTYFWKHIVLPKLRQLGGTDDLIAYVSLYGVQKPEEIRSALFAQLHPRLAKAGAIASVFGPSLIEFFGISSPDPEKFTDTFSGLIDRLDHGKRLIICFDDLERVAMPIEVALAQINQFVEHVGAKVVVLCNDAEIPKDTRPAYKKTKEKVIRTTRVYTGDPIQVLPAIIDEFAAEPAYHKFLGDNHELIADILRRSGLVNLRALKYAMLVLQVAFDQMSRLQPDDTKSHQTILKVLLPVCFDLQEKKISYNDARSILTDGNSAIFLAYMGKKDEKPSPLAAFGDRYGFSGLESNLPKSEALAQLIETGYLDPAKLQSEIDEQNADQSSGQMAVSALLNGWFLMPDDSIQSTVAAAIDFLRKGEVTSPQHLLNLANVFDWMGRENVPGILDGTAVRAFEEGLAKTSAGWTVHEHEMLFLERAAHPEERETELGKKVRDFIRQSYATFKDKKLRENIQLAFGALPIEPERFCLLLWDDQGKGIGRHPIAPFITSQSLANALFGSPSNIRHEIATAFRRRYSEQYKVKALLEDLQWLQEFHSKIKCHLELADKKAVVANLNLRWVKEHVEEAITRIQNLNAATIPPATKMEKEAAT